MADQTPRREMKVRITKPESRAKAKPEYIYHWDRIIGALAALVLLIGLIGYGLYDWLRPSLPLASVEVEDVQGPEKIVAGTVQQSVGAVQRPMPSPTTPAPGIAAADRIMGADSPAIDVESLGTEADHAQSPIQPERVFEDPPRQAAREVVDVDLPQRAEAEVLPAEIGEPAQAQTPVGETIAEPATVQTPAPESGEEEQRITGQGLPGEALPESSVADAPGGAVEVETELVSETEPGEALPESSAADASGRPVEVAAEPVSESEPGEAVAVADTPEEESGQEHFRSRNTSLSSPAVKRFVLAQSVTGNEPKGSLADITLDARGVAEVCSFSEVIGLEGEVLEYRWLHEGKQVLRVSVPVGAQRWRSHSTKRIYERMKGAWRAELRDSAGNLLASADFVF
ncbi:MAG: DUF2914 domain-containing protein [Pseudomonadota bacterium]|nr:DUF2914 domain-containing protein [Pseudomonadota bacterium]